MSVAIWARKTVALGLAATLFGPSVSLLSAQDAQNQEEKRARRKQQEENQQRKQAEREQQQAERRAQREQKVERQQERAQQEQQARQRDREERVQRQQERQADDQRARQQQREAQEQRRSERERADQENRARRQDQWQRQQQQADQAQRERERRERRNEDAREAQAQAEAQARAAESARREQQAREQAERERQDRAQRVDDARYRQPRPDGRDRDRDYDRNDGRRGRVITENQRSVIIRENRDRSVRWSNEWRDRQNRGARYARELQNQRRYAHYRYQQRYLDRLRLQVRYDWDRYDWDRDPYFYSAPDWRYRYHGRYYEINDYGADVLREAVNLGYEEGFYAGQADREDRWHGDYRDSYVYEDATYGYRGLYVDEEQYAYYFRQGFERGYRDGYDNHFRYGRRDDTGLKIAAGVLAGILVFEALR